MISNAVKYSKPGGRIWVYVDGSTITVKDEGIGIKEADLPCVFERFYQEENDGEGSSLGLSLCKDLIEKMGEYFSQFSRRSWNSR